MMGSGENRAMSEKEIERTTGTYSESIFSIYRYINFKEETQTFVLRLKYIGNM
jgi:hypothetical protein